MRTIVLLLAWAAWCSGADYRTPARNRAAHRTDDGSGTILPGGRLLSPYGTQYTTGPGPFGLAISPSGDRVVTSDSGPDRFTVTFIEKDGGKWTSRQLAVSHKDKDDKKDLDDDWQSTFMGLAFLNENALFVSEGESGQVRLIDCRTRKRLARLDLNAGGFSDSYSGDLALDRERGVLYVVDQANFRVAIFDAAKRQLVGNVKVGRLPFSIALSPDAKRIYVTNVGMFSYKVLPGADAKRPRETGIAFPAFGFPSKESMDGTVVKNASGQDIVVPPVGDPNVAESNSVAVVNVVDPAKPRVVKFIRTGLPFGPRSLGGSSPSAVLATTDCIYVSNSTNDSISVIDPAKLDVIADVPIRIRGLEQLRGVIPMGLAYSPDRKQLFVAEAGINAVGVIDSEKLRVIGHIPAGWFPTRVMLQRDDAWVTNAKGHGAGPDATLEAPMPRTYLDVRRRGSVSQYKVPSTSELDSLTAEVLAYNGFHSVAGPAALPTGIKHVVVIVKENRTFDEIFGDIAGAPKLARYGRGVTPNHHALAESFSMSDNFYADSEVSVDGHHWLVGSYPNEWTESSLMASYAGGKTFRLTPDAPGRLDVAESNSSVHPEDQLEAGTLWHSLDRHGITFRNFGEGFEFAGVDEGTGLKPTGARYLTNVPMPEPLFRNTSREYPNFNTNIPDQFRASQFIAEIDRLYRKPGKPLPQFLFLHLPQDHTADPRPQDGYPTRAAFVADNDYALGRIVDYLSHLPEWKQMAIFITEDDAAGGVDHVDAHRTVLMIVSPYAKRHYVAHTNSSFPGMLKTVYRLLGLPPLNLFDAASADLSECFTSEPDFTPYTLLSPNLQVFDPTKVREPLDPSPGAAIDSPGEIRKQQPN